MKRSFIFIPVVFIALAACASDKARSLKTGKEYFKLIDEKKYDLAYDLISDEDKQFLSAADFSRALEDHYKGMYYPPGLDNVSEIVAARMPAVLIESFTKKGINCFPDPRKAFILKEVRRVPDIEAIKKTLGDQAGITLKMILNVLVTGVYPMRPDSSRFALIAVEKGRPRIVIGARYIKARESLQSEYEAYLKKNLIISILGKGYIYRTPRDSVFGMIKYNLTNNSPDTLSAFYVRGEFKGRSTIDTILYAPSLKGIPPRQTITDRIEFSDPFLLNVLGYFYNRMNVKANIMISRYPSSGDGPYYDSLMNSKPNAAITEFTDPVKQGARTGRH